MLPTLTKKTVQQSPKYGKHEYKKSVMHVLVFSNIMVQNEIQQPHYTEVQL